MRVLQLSFSPLGGAGTVALRTHRILNPVDGVDSSVFFLHPTNLRSNPTYDLALTGRSFLDELLVKNGKSKSMVTVLRRGKANDLPEIEPDVVHLHWWYDFDPNWLVRRYPHSRFVITLHDDRAFTGGCHSVGNCAKFLNGCAGCPIVRPFFRSLIESRFREMRDGLSKFESLSFISPSESMRKVASAAGLGDIAPIQVISNPVDDVYWESASSQAHGYRTRHRDSELRFGFIAQNLNDPNKNTERAISLVKTLNERGVRTKLELIGGGGVKADAELFLNHGSLSPEDLASKAYFWDSIISCSDSENAPLVIAEMAALGLPTITHSTPSTDELLHKTGQHPIVRDWGAFPENDVVAFLEEFIGQNSIRMRDMIREKAELNFGPRVITDKLLEVYDPRSAS